MKFARVDAASLRAVGASAILAVDPTIIGGTVRLAAEEPSKDAPASVEVVGLRIDGPLAQRASADLCGYVDGYDAVAARFEVALGAAERGVVMVIDSPGGDVAGLEAAVDRMREVKAASGKRVVAYVDEMAASAAYWIASAVADEIVAPKAARVGSIGCIGAIVDESEAERMAGREWVVHREPAGKAAGMSAAPLRDLAAEQLSSDVKECAKRFYAAVSEARPALTVDAIKAMNGQMYGARVAQRMGLIDRVGTMETALALASKKAAPKRQEKRQMKSLISALGLAPDAQDESIEAAAIKAIDAVKETAQASEGKARDALAALEKANADAESLRAELSGLRAQSDKAERTALIEQAVQAGKLPPARRDDLAAKGEQHGTEWLTALVDALPVLAPSKSPVAAAPPTASNDLTPREIAMCAEMNIDPKDYAARKASVKKA